LFVFGSTESQYLILCSSICKIFETSEIFKYLEKGSAFYAPAASGVQMAEAYLNDQKKLLPCAVQLNGEYGVQNVYAGVPVVIGKDGVEKIEQIDLDEKEKKERVKSATTSKN